MSSKRGLANITLNNAQTPRYVFGYDALSRRNSLTRPNGVDTTYGYDPVSRLTGLLHKLGTTTLDGATYTYDNAENRKSRIDKRTNVTLAYGYDNIYQLQTAKQGTTTKESYTYDLVGNRLSSLGVSPYNYNSSNELTSTPSGNYGYDNNGNRTSDPRAAQYTWDYENCLTKLVLPGTGGTVTFLYDPFGRRIQKAITKNSITTTTNYLYDGANLLESLDQSANVLARYTETLGIDDYLQELVSGMTSYYEQDGLGSVSSLSNSAGALANTYTYDSYGKLTASTGTLANPFEYAGREFDTETGGYFYRARYYDQTVGRFLSEDPIRSAAGMNFFAYVHNNPAGLDDPTGLCDKDCQLSISCGPTPRTGGFSHCTVTIQNGSRYQAYDAQASGNHWWSQLIFPPPIPGTAPGSNRFVRNVPVPCDCAQNAANDINSSNLIYSAPFQNSNTAAAMMAADCGVYPGSWPSGAWGAHVPAEFGPPANSNPWSPFNPWPPTQ